MKLVDFYAPWCKYCVELMPEIDALAHENPRRISVEKLNVGSRDNAAVFKTAMKLRCLPTIIIYDDKNDEIERWDADMDETFQSFVNRHI